MFFCCDSITFKYKSFLAGIELNFGIANRITGFRFYFFFDRFEKFLKTLKIVYLCVCFLVLVLVWIEEYVILFFIRLQGFSFSSWKK